MSIHVSVCVLYVSIHVSVCVCVCVRVVCQYAGQWEGMQDDDKRQTCQRTKSVCVVLVAAIHEVNNTAVVCQV